jgi:hypothetical protein
VFWDLCAIIAGQRKNKLSSLSSDEIIDVQKNNINSGIIKLKGVKEIILIHVQKLGRISYDTLRKHHGRNRKPSEGLK